MLRTAAETARLGFGGVRDRYLATYYLHMYYNGAITTGERVKVTRHKTGAVTGT